MTSSGDNDIKICNPDYAFKPWVPKKVITCLKNLQRDPNWSNDGLNFLSTLFENIDLQPFFLAIINNKQYSIEDFICSLLGAEEGFLQRDIEQKDVKDFQKDAAKLRKHIDKLLYALKGIMPIADRYKMFGLRKYPTELIALQNSITALETKATQSIKRSNPLRPANRKSFPTNKRLKKLEGRTRAQSDNNDARTNYYARFLMEHFKAHKGLGYKTADKKKIICELVNTLFETELTPKNLDDLKKDG